MEGAGSPGHGIRVEATVTEVPKLWGSAIPSEESTGQELLCGRGTTSTTSETGRKDWEFIEMGELHPEFWIQKEEEPQRGGGSGSKGRQMCGGNALPSMLGC